MVDTINAAGRGVESKTYRTGIVLHVLGLMTASLVLGAILVLVNSVFRPLLAREPAAWVGLALLVAAWAARPLSGFGLPFPRSHWQVPEQWRSTLPFEVTMLSYGTLLGAGFLTDVVFPAYWVLVVLSVGYIGPTGVLVAWLSYGAARSTITLVRALGSRAAQGDSRPIRHRAWLAAAHLITMLLFAVWILSLDERSRLWLPR